MLNLFQKHKHFLSKNFNQNFFGVCIWNFPVNDKDNFNSLRPSDTYMRQQTKPPLVQMMPCRLLYNKLLSQPMLILCQLDPYEYTSVKY